VVILRGQPNGDQLILLYLQLLAESIDHEGYLRYSKKVPYTEKMLATLTGHTEDNVRTFLGHAKDTGLIEKMKNGTLYLTKAQDMVGAETNWAESKRQYRAKSDTKEDNVLPMSGQSPTELELDIDLDQEQDARDIIKGLSVVETNVPVTEKHVSVTERGVSGAIVKDSIVKERVAKKLAVKTADPPQLKIKHPTLGVPMNQTRYDTLVGIYGRQPVDEAIQDRLDWENSKGKPHAKDYASAAANWMKRDGVAKKPGAGLKSMMALHPPECPCGGEVRTTIDEAMCMSCDNAWDLQDQEWVLREAK